MIPKQSERDKMEEFYRRETAIFNDLWAGAAFHIINAVLKKCPDWSETDRNAMVHMIVAQLARRYGVIEDDEDDEDDNDEAE